MKSDVYFSGSELDLDLDRNLKAAAVWSDNVFHATRGFSDFSGKWAQVLCFGTPAHPDLSLTRARFAGAVLEREAKGSMDLSLAIPATPKVTSKVEFVDGKRKTTFEVPDFAEDYEESETKATAKDFYRASFLAHSLYLGCASVARVQSTPVDFQDGWMEKKEELVSDSRKAFGDLVLQGMAFLRDMAERNPSPSCVVSPSPSRFDKECMGLVGVIRNCCGFLTL